MLFLRVKNTFALTHWLYLRPPTNSGLHEGLGWDPAEKKTLKHGGKKRRPGDAIGYGGGDFIKDTYANIGPECC